MPLKEKSLNNQASKFCFRILLVIARRIKRQTKKFCGTTGNEIFLSYNIQIAAISFSRQKKEERPGKRRYKKLKKFAAKKRRTGEKNLSVTFDGVGIAASAIRAVGSDSDFVEFAVATVFVVFAAANVAHNSVIDIFH